MHSVLHPQPAVSQTQKKPILDSYDSGEEFSFYHWVEVRKLVDNEEAGASSDSRTFRRPVRATTASGRLAKHA